MASVEDPRHYVLGYLYERCGFRFDESSDLSPDTRRQIGDLARDVQAIWTLDSQMVGQKAQMAKGTPLAGIPSALGGLLIAAVVLGFFAGGPAGDLASLFVVGLMLIVLGAVVSQRRKRRIASVIAGAQQVRNDQWQGWAHRANALSTKVLEESRDVYRQKVKPRVVEVKVDFAQILQAAQGKGLIVDRVKCPSCGAAISLPVSGDVAKCSYCGNEVTATSVLDKMKSILA